jgi:UDP-N-acetylglucosamine 2-epimerase (non-hydrolysing)
MAPVIQALNARKEAVDSHVLITAQHRELLDQALEVFHIRADTDLNIMSHNQSVATVTCRVLNGMMGCLTKVCPDIVLAQGDTTTVMATAMACFYMNVPFGHVEAGLRTYDLQAPCPEEYNRRVTAVSASWHFAPTPRARANLLKEQVCPASVYVTGNPIVDAIKYILNHTKKPPAYISKPYILMTCHRRESFGQPVRRIFSAVAEFARKHPEYTVWYPVHPNPNILQPAREYLGEIKNIFLDKPLDYISFVHAMADCDFMLTDSGGMQEEAVSIGKHALIMRKVTERPEALESGLCRLAGTSFEEIYTQLGQLASGPRMPVVINNPFGDGHAGRRIAEIVLSNK